LSATSTIAVRNILVSVWFSAFALICFLPGCERRELIEPTPGMDIAQQYWINVLLFDNIRKSELTAVGGFRVVDEHGGVIASIGKSKLPVRAELRDGKIAFGAKVFTGDVILTPGKPFVMEINGRQYRGNLKLLVNDDGKSFDVINSLPIEAYLAGVVGAEMPSYWEPEALKAQAVAARTYCLYYKQRFGVGRSWDVSSTQATQVYRGVSAETLTIWDAVNQTAGEVLYCRYEDGMRKIFPTYYSSTCGGHTESSKNVFGGDYFEPLGGVKCPYCKKVAKMSLFFWKMVEFDAEDVSLQLLAKYPKLKKLGKIKNMEIHKESNYGNFSRATSVKLLGEKGEKAFLRADDLRLSIDPTGAKIKSAMCSIMKKDNVFRFYAGRGYGHGVGMCQCGAEGMAREKKGYANILKYYYPNSEIVVIY